MNIINKIKQSVRSRRRLKVAVEMAQGIIAHRSSEDKTFEQITSLAFTQADHILAYHQDHTGRHDDPTPISCTKCHWIGKRADAIHTYTFDHSGEAEPIDKCPWCYKEV